MNKIVINILFFFILMIIIFILDYVFVMKRKLKSKKRNKEDIMEISYLIYKFKLDKKKINYNSMCLWCSLINGFIISLVVTVISNIDLKLMWQLLIGFALLFGLIYSIYEIYGRHLARKGWKKKDE